MPRMGDPATFDRLVKELSADARRGMLERLATNAPLAEEPFGAPEPDARAPQSARGGASQLRTTPRLPDESSDRGGA